MAQTIGHQKAKPSKNVLVLVQLIPPVSLPRKSRCGPAQKKCKNLLDIDADEGGKIQVAWRTRRVHIQCRDPASVANDWTFISTFHWRYIRGLGMDHASHGVNRRVTPRIRQSRLSGERTEGSLDIDLSMRMEVLQLLYSMICLDLQCPEPNVVPFITFDHTKVGHRIADSGLR